MMNDAELKLAIDATFVGRTGDLSDAHLKELRALYLRLPRLLEDEAILNALYARGVDFWEGYNDALDTLPNPG
jgi:hypothetical protein